MDVFCIATTQNEGLDVLYRSTPIKTIYDPYWGNGDRKTKKKLTLLLLILEKSLFKQKCRD